ncbi:MULTISPECIES: hypothetical protein [Lysinibacillus]|uniref:hypothetical protein n=1 Tax=Lysinibacillus TaxID=400634 RepID=UPI000C19986A|nr:MULTISPECIES: hypothetical protein [Lysinibacillus]MBX8945955.1 hypothetical protein [Lysinibacillus sp. K60]PIJ97994.1 hypothetical protein CTN02_09630 [Lysinibacillus sphaericus]
MIKIPVDLTQEQKTVLAYFSIRQLMLVGPVAVVTVMQLVLFNWPFIGGWVEFLWKILIVLISNGISVSLAFIYLEKYDCYLSEFVIRRYKFWRSQKTYTN